MNERTLPALDGSNPLGFLAALGALNVLSDRDGLGEGARLSWREDGAWHPVLWCPDQLTKEALIQAVMDDLRSWPDDPAVQLKYSKKEGEKVWDLKPPPEVYFKFLKGLVSAAQESRSRRAVDLAAAFATDVAVDGSGNIKPTSLHFTAGQQQFLAMVHALAVELTVEDVDEALFGPWRYARDLPVLQWDNTTSRDHALRAGDPSKEKKLGVPGADWLAFRGMSFIRVVPKGGKILTTGCSGTWKEGTFTWPLWTVPLSRSVIRTVLTLRMADLTTDAERRRLGIGVVFESSIRRSDQGGYGTFSPARVV